MGEGSERSWRSFLLYTHSPSVANGTQSDASEVPLSGEHSDGVCPLERPTKINIKKPRALSAASSEEAGNTEIEGLRIDGLID